MVLNALLNNNNKKKKKKKKIDSNLETERDTGLTYSCYLNPLRWIIVFKLEEITQNIECHR